MEIQEVVSKVSKKKQYILKHLNSFISFLNFIYLFICLFCFTLLQPVTDFVNL